MKIDVAVPCGRQGCWEVEEFNVSEADASSFNVRESQRAIKAGAYKKLTRNGFTIMSNTPAEVNDHMNFINKAKGNILITGLGLGVVLTALLQKEEVKSITVIELSKFVIKLVAPTFRKNKRVKIIKANVYDWEIPKGIKYDYVWHDIWDGICSDNLEDMKRLKQKFAKHSKWQGFWCKSECHRAKLIGC